MGTYLFPRLGDVSATIQQNAAVFINGAIPNNGMLGDLNALAYGIRDELQNLTDGFWRIDQLVIGGGDEQWQGVSMKATNLAGDVEYTSAIASLTNGLNTVLSHYAIDNLQQVSAGFLTQGGSGNNTGQTQKIAYAVQPPPSNKNNGLFGNFTQQQKQQLVLMGGALLALAVVAAKK